MQVWMKLGFQTKTQKNQVCFFITMSECYDIPNFTGFWNHLWNSLQAFSQNWQSLYSAVAGFSLLYFNLEVSKIRITSLFQHIFQGF